MKIRVGPDELAMTLRIWLTVIGQRRPEILRNIWTRRGEDYDKQKIEIARRELARELTDRIEIAKWDVMREATGQEAMPGHEALRAGSAARDD